MRVGYLLSVVAASLFLGTLVYAVERPANSSLIFASNLHGTLPSLFGVFGGSLPSFTHALAFTLLSTLVLGMRALWLSASLWLSLEVLFEVAQHPQVAAFLEGAGLGLDYFRYGTFDTFDLLASALGVALALCLCCVQRRGVLYA